jgi:hypothetical protein
LSGFLKNEPAAAFGAGDGHLSHISPFVAMSEWLFLSKANRDAHEQFDHASDPYGHVLGLSAVGS